MVGVYSSEQNARAAVERLSRQPGFRDAPESISVDAYELDHDSWSEGFATMTTILVRLVEESVDVWRPVFAQVLPGELYEIQGPIPEGEAWEFSPGTLVRCEMRTLESGPAVVAVAQAGAA